MCDAPTPPPAPKEVSVAEDGLKYLRGMIDLQPELLAAEQETRPEYNTLNLQDMGRTLMGSDYDNYVQNRTPSNITPPRTEAAPGGPAPSGGYNPSNSSYSGGGGFMGDGTDDASMYDPMFGSAFGGSSGGQYTNAYGQGGSAGQVANTGNNVGQYNVSGDANAQSGQPNTVTQGDTYVPGALELVGFASQELQDLNQDISSQQREADIADVERLGGRASEAFLNANPRLKAALEDAEGMTGETDRDEYGRLEEILMGPQSQLTQTLGQRGQELAESQGALTPFEQMALEEQTRSASSARGRALDNSSIADELGARIEAQRGRKMQDLAMAADLNQQQLGAEQQKISGLGSLAQLKQGQQAQDRQYQLNYANVLSSTANDPFMAILNRPSRSVSQGQAQAGAAQSLIGQSTPQLFNPDAGINLALQNNANQANFLSNIYGAQAGYKGAVIGGGLNALGNILSIPK